MGHSKIPLYAYVDDTGNTGHNLFDEAQPDFFTVALITKRSFDASYHELTSKIAVSSASTVSASKRDPRRDS